MKLKKIENAVVHCKTKEEAKKLLNSVAIKDGDPPSKWYTYWHDYEEDTCYEIRGGVVRCYGEKKYWDDVIEFPDLIEPEPELTAEEVLEWLKEHYDDNEYENAFGNDYTCYGLFARLATSEIIEKISKWKADHEKQEPGKKEPEVECANVCRIIKIDEAGNEKCVHEEGIDLLKSSSTQMADILKRYIAGHEGNFVAVRAFVCRVKKG